MYLASGHHYIAVHTKAFLGIRTEAVRVTFKTKESDTSTCLDHIDMPTLACRRGEEVPSQAMRSVTSFLNRVLAMSMEDQEMIFK